MTTRATSSFLGLAAGAAMAITACGGPEPADPTTAQEKVTASVPAIADQAERAFKGIEKSPALESLGRSMGSVKGLAGGRTEEYRRRFLRDGLEVEEASPGEALARLLNEKVFTSANYQGDGVYLLAGEDFCPEPRPYEPASERERCISDFDAIEVRVRAETMMDALNATLLIGPERAAPVAAVLRTDRLAVVADLAETRRALLHIDTVVEHVGPIPAVMEGLASLAIVVNGDADVTVEAAILEAIRIEGPIGDDLGNASLSLDPKDPLLAVRAQAAQMRSATS